MDDAPPHVLKRLLSCLEITTVQELNWTGITNGALLRLANDRFDVLITTDKNLQYQQNLTGLRLAIIQLPTNQVPIVASLAPAVQQVLGKIQPGEFVEIPCSECCRKTTQFKLHHSTKEPLTVVSARPPNLSSITQLKNHLP